MSAAPRQPVADFLPDNAPFTPDQRAWLNGLFAGLTALDDGSIKALSPDEFRRADGIAWLDRE